MLDESLFSQENALEHALIIWSMSQCAQRVLMNTETKAADIPAAGPSRGQQSWISKEARKE